MANINGNPGNSGGRPYSEENRKKAATLKGIALDFAIQALTDPDYPADKKEEIVLRILPTCMPREGELGNNDLGPLQVNIISYSNTDAINNNTLPVDSGSASTADTDESGQA